jgi:hypothetical protein
LVASARGGEEVRFGTKDASRLAAALPGAVAQAAASAGRDIELDYSDKAAPFEQGVLLVGERQSLELSPRALVQSSREELRALIGVTLFSEQAGGD